MDSNQSQQAEERALHRRKEKSSRLSLKRAFALQKIPLNSSVQLSISKFRGRIISLSCPTKSWPPSQDSQA